MKKRIAGIVLCLALMCTLLPCAFAIDPYVAFNPLQGAFPGGSTDIIKVDISEDGLTVTPPASPTRDGYTFKCWTISGTEAAITESPILLSTYGIKSGDTLTAVWEVSAPATYSIASGSVPDGVTLNYLDGETSSALTPGSVTAGASVLIQVTPPEGYYISSLTICEATGGNVPCQLMTGTTVTTYGFTMPSNNVLVNVTTEQTPATPSPSPSPTATPQTLVFSLPSTFTTTSTYDFDATVTPATAADKVTWKSSDTSVITVKATNTSGTKARVQPLKTGTALITATLGTGTDAVSFSQTVTVSLSNLTYKVVSNANGCWYYDVPSSYQIIVNAPYAKAVKSVSVYNSTTGASYTASIGTDVTKTYDVSKPEQTILTFTKAYMQTLPRYTYQTLTVTFEDGTASTYLHILSSTAKPVTGDTELNPYRIALALGAAGLGAALTIHKKENNL